MNGRTTQSRTEKGRFGICCVNHYHYCPIIEEPELQNLSFRRMKGFYSLLLRD